MGEVSIRFPIFVVVLLLWSWGSFARSCEHKDAAKCSSTFDIRAQTAALFANPGKLRPKDLPKPSVFRDFGRNDTVQLKWNGITIDQVVSRGSVQQMNNVKPGHTAVTADFALLPALVDREKIGEMLKLLQAHRYFDEDPDTVDGMPTYEMFVESPDLGEPSIKVLETDPVAQVHRNALREKLRAIMNPYLNQKITPLVRKLYPAQCNKKKGRYCTPCYSLIRRYRHGERQSHETHHDGHAIVTVVVSLSDYGTEYSGGLYIGTKYGQREYLGLNRGDAAIHQSTLLHGVKVYEIDENPERTIRFSWILWYRDSETCADVSHEWYANCSDRGDALCQELHASKVGNIPGISQDEAQNEVLRLNREAALGGAATPAVKIARAYLRRLPSVLNYNETNAEKFYRLAIEAHHPDGHYGMADLILTRCSRVLANPYCEPEQLSRVVAHLETGALFGHAYSMFNLGIVHAFGYGVPKINSHLAAKWFIASGLPEGYFAAAHQSASIGDSISQQKYINQAGVLGMFQPWRKLARDSTGSGGATGVSYVSHKVSQSITSNS